MLRRSTLTSSRFCSAVAAGGPFKPTPARLQTATPYTDRDAEIEREKAFRDKIVGKMAMRLPTYDQTIYASYETSPGQFNSGGAGLNGGNNGASNTSSSSGTFSGAAQQQQMGFNPFNPFSFGGLGGLVNNNNTPANNNNGTQQQQQSGKPKPGVTDWFTFLTGLVLVGYSLKLLFRGAGSNDGTLIPMWATTPAMKGKYILFITITNEQGREALKNEFAQIQKQMPFLSFFDWLDQRYPQWGAGRRYTQEHAVAVMTQAIGPDSNPSATARLTASVVQKRTGGLFGLTGATAPLADRQSLVDELIDTVQPAISGGANNNGGGFFGGLFGGAAAPPQQQQQYGGFTPALAPQWGMPQQQQYNPYMAAPQPPMGGGMPPIMAPQQGYPQQQQQYYNNVSAMPVGATPAAVNNNHSNQQQQGYFQQPAATELRGTQEVSLSDITGGAAVLQHHYVAPAVTNAVGGSTISDDATSGQQRDPLARTA